MSEHSRQIASPRDVSPHPGAKRSLPHYSEDRPISNKRKPDRNTHRHDAPTSSKSDTTFDKRRSPISKKPDAPLKLSTVTGGRYIPPGRLKLMQQQITDKTSTEYQMLSWNALKRSLNGIINKVNVSNITSIVEELFNENLIRGRGLLAQSVMQAQMFSPVFSQVYACLVAIINTKLPSNGELILHRVVLQFQRSYRRKSKKDCVATVKFIAHLVNQGVAHELLPLQVLTVLLDAPTDDSIELCIALLKECGHKLKEVSGRAFNAVNETLRNVLHEGKLQKRVLYMVETYLKILKDGFKDYPSVIPELDLVPDEDQIIHLVSLEDDLQVQTELNVFRADAEFAENEEKYQQLKVVILGADGSEEGSEDGAEGDGSSEEEKEKEQDLILDKTGTNDTNFRRTMYLTLMSSINFEETAHKIMRLKLPDGCERGVLDMVLECACQERSYMKYFGLTAQRLCLIRKPYMESAGIMFIETFSTIHRLESNKLRNAARFFAHLLYSDAIPWSVLDCIHLNEEETNASSRIFIKILFQELAEYMGLLKLNQRLKQPELSPYFLGLFSQDNPKHSRFSVNFFTTIGLGGLTEGLREYLKSNAAALQEMEAGSSSDSSEDDNDSDDESTSSEDDSSEVAASLPEPQKPNLTPNGMSTENPYSSTKRQDDDPPHKMGADTRSHRTASHEYGRTRERLISPFKEFCSDRDRRATNERDRYPHKESRLDRTKQRIDRSRSPENERKRNEFKSSIHEKRSRSDKSKHSRPISETNRSGKKRRRDRNVDSEH